MVTPEENPKPAFDPKDHPWIEMATEDDPLEEVIRYSLDEIRTA